jgi:hypothetical protein
LQIQCEFIHLAYNNQHSRGTRDDGNKPMKKFVLTALLILLIPFNVYSQSLDEAARQAARQHNAKVLSAHTEQQGKNKVHVIKLLTTDGVVKTVRVSVRSPEK